MEKNRFKIFFTVFLLSIFPISYIAIKKHINFDNLSAIIFILIMLFLIIKYKKNLDFEPMLKIANIPIIYAVLYRSKFGIKLMDKLANKYRELIKLLGYSFIGFGFLGMVFISINVLVMLFSLFVSPKEASQNVALVLPLTNIPGLGYLSFWHFLITIFVTILIHEFAHGIVARAHKIRVKNSGVGLFALLVPLFPLAFVEPDEKEMKKEKDVVQYSIFSAGPVINIIFAFFIMLLMTNVLIPIEDSITNEVGFSFTGLMEGYPAETAGMKPGMIINKVNGKNTLTYQQFHDTVGQLKPGEKLVLSTDEKEFTIITKASEEDADKGLIGITNIQNEKRIKEEYSQYSTAFFWIKDLIKWFYYLNLIIGLMNLLPLMITDGGRMLKTALKKIIKDSKKADKLWAMVGFIFIFTLLFALVVKHSLQFFSFIGLS